jgi:hypothetical protein
LRETYFVPTKIFLFFSWGETPRVSLHLARASRLWLAGWRVAVGAKLFEFRPGGVDIIGPGPDKIRILSKALKTPPILLSALGIRCAKFPPPIFAQLMRFGHSINLPFRQAQAGGRRARSAQPIHELTLVCMANS